MTVMSVATPMVSPSMVSEARSLWARRALKHSARLSRTASIGAEEHFQLSLFQSYQCFFRGSDGQFHSSCARHRVWRELRISPHGMIEVVIGKYDLDHIGASCFHAGTVERKNLEKI